MLALHAAAVGEHGRHATGAGLDTAHRDRFAIDGAARGCALGERVRRQTGVDVTVERLVERTDEAVGDGERPQFGDASRADQLGRHTMVAADHAEVAQLVHPSLRAGERQRTGLGEVDVDPGLDLEPAIQIDAVRGKCGQHVSRAALHDETCGVPRRAGGNPVTLEDEDLPTEGGEVIGDRCPDDAATDDDDLSAFG